jgi:hypothetical protein
MEHQDDMKTYRFNRTPKWLKDVTDHLNTWQLDVVSMTTEGEFYILTVDGEINPDELEHLGMSEIV